MITDDHKEVRSSMGSDHNGNSSSVMSSSYQSVPPSPVSLGDSSEANTDVSYKRRRESDWSESVRSNSSYAAAASSSARIPSRSNSSHRLDMASPASSDGNYANALSQLTMTPVNGAMSGAVSAGLNQASLPAIQRVIPAQGSTRGGIEVTLLGSGFHSGLTAKFGDSPAISTHCWSDTTIVTHLPPAAVPGPVVVCFEGMQAAAASSQIFTYVDDTDMQLIELALQVVGLKMNGKLEDARNIAMRIVGSGSGDQAGGSGAGGASRGGDFRGETNWVSLSSLASQKRAKLTHRRRKRRAIMRMLFCVAFSWLT
jgi:hypothetical protein